MDRSRQFRALLSALTAIALIVSGCATAAPPTPAATTAAAPTPAAASPSAATSPTPAVSPSAAASPSAATTPSVAASPSAATTGTPAVTGSPSAATTATGAAAPAVTINATTVNAPVPAGQPAGNDWLTYGGNYYNQRYSSLNQITPSNVAQLKGAWTFKTGHSGAGTSFESSPVVVGGIMYLTGPQSQVYALDARTGKEIWRYEPTISSVESLPLCCGQDNRGVAIGDGQVYVGQLDAKLTALDAATGKVNWSVQVDDPRAGYSETMAPLFYNGMVIIRVAGAEYEIRGHVQAYDSKTGKQIWQFYTIPGPGETGHDSWPSNNDAWKYGGGSVWGGLALDPDLGLLYFAVGNPSPDLDGRSRAGDNLFTESLVAINVKDGTYKWHFQEVHHDIWDYDATSPPILFDATVNGNAVKGIAEAGKTGWVYFLDRATGKPLVPITEKPVTQDAAQHTAKTQPFPQGDSFVPLTCGEKVGNYSSGGIFTPFEETPILICPGANGGSEWSPISYNAQTNMVYACGIVQPQIWTSKPEKIAQGTLRLGSAFVTPPGATTSGTFTAIDAGTNKQGWQSKWDNMCIGGSTSTAGGLTFAGEGNGNFDAYDAKSGNRLWQFQTGAGVDAPPVTYSVDGQQYVAVASGGNFQLNYPRGDTLWVFSLNGTQGPVAAPTPPSSTVAPQALAVNTVHIVDFAFQPAWILIPPGTTVTWINDGPSVHTTTSDNGVWDSGLLQPGQKFSYTFNTPGTYDYFCTPHPFMRGKVIVDKNAPKPVAAATGVSAGESGAAGVSHQGPQPATPVGPTQTAAVTAGPAEAQTATAVVTAGPPGAGATGTPNASTTPGAGATGTPNASTTPSAGGGSATPTP